MYVKSMSGEQAQIITGAVSTMWRNRASFSLTLESTNNRSAAPFRQDEPPESPGAPAGANPAAMKPASLLTGFGSGNHEPMFRITLLRIPYL
jgi:hypothetical protein